MTEHMQVLTTVDSTEEAERLGRSITGARLAACVQIVGPIRSLFWWQGKPRIHLVRVAAIWRAAGRVSHNEHKPVADPDPVVQV